MTFVPRKDSVEIVIKLQSGVYAVVTALPCGHDEMMLFSNWSTYFNRLHNMPKPEEFLSRMKKSCPKFVDLCIGKAPYDLITLPNHPEATGIGKVIKTQFSDNFICDVATSENIRLAFDLANYTLCLYHEIKSNCKLNDWVRSLEMLWGKIRYGLRIVQSV